MANFLDQTGLTALIEKIQNQILLSKTYTNITATSSDSNRFFLKATSTNNTPWIIKFRVTSECILDSNSLHSADVVLGGVGKKLSYYHTNNIVYDTARVSAKDIVVIFRTDDFYIGVDLNDKSYQNHKITFDIQYFSGCELSTLSIAKSIQNDIHKFEYIPFNISGEYTNKSSGDYVTRDDLADVAFSGSYEDLSDLPELLSVLSDEDGEKLIFFKS